MPPKKGEKKNKKTEQKIKEKIIEDKTFGLKNKKGAKQQTYIKSVQHQVKYGNQKSSKIEDGPDKKKEREQKKKEQSELNMLFKPVSSQKVAKGVDPKSVVCAFFKQGTCRKGDKCKFSHDLTLERKSEKRSIYDDGSQEKDTMDDWDEAKLKEVVEQKHGEADKKVPKTNIVCKHFIKAIEESKYGWFWSCPSGDKCIYKHALPPGFVLKKKKPVDQPEEEKISLEELIEEERAKLGPNQTKITLETFKAWKDRKIEEKRQKLAQEQKRKKNDFKEGKALGITGREVFQFNPDMVLADDDEADEGIIEREAEDAQEDTAVRDLTAEALASQALEATGAAGTISTSQSREGATSGALPEMYGGDKNHATVEDDADRLGAAAPIPLQGTADGTGDTLVNGTDTIGMDVEVDEELFDEDLDNIDEELDQIDLN